MFSFAFCFANPQATLFHQKEIKLSHHVTNDGMQLAPEGGGEGRDTKCVHKLRFFFLCRCDPTWVMASSFLRFLDHTQRRTTVGMTYDSSRRVISSSQRPLPDNTRHSQQTNIHAPGGIQTHDLSRRAAAELRLRPRGHWDRQQKLTL